MLVVCLALSSCAVLPARAQVPHIIHCSGSQDVSDEVEDAIYGGHSYILFTSGVCKITKTIKVTNQDGLRLEGSGRDRTLLYWYGNEGVSGSTGPMFSIQNSRGVELSSFGVCMDPGTTLDSAIDIYNACFDGWERPDGSNTCDGYDPTTAQGSHGNSFHDLSITTCAGPTTSLHNGIRILLHPQFNPKIAGHLDCGLPESDCHNDGHVFSEVHVTTVRKASFVIEGQESVGNVFRHVHCKAIFGTFEDPVTGFPNEDQIGDYCVRAGRMGVPGTSGSFSWYGGLANGVKEAVFKVGRNPEKVTISGVYTERAKAILVGTDDPGSVAIPGGVHIDSYQFNPVWINDWNTGNNPDGTIIDLAGTGPLSMVNNKFGAPISRGTTLSFCWADPVDDSLDVSSFEFTGNLVETTLENPFAPRDDCIYPTRQDANLVTGQYDGFWHSMPVVYTELDADPGPNPVHTFSVNRQPTAHTHFHVNGSGEIRCLEDGFQGQRIILVGGDIDGTVDIQPSRIHYDWFLYGCYNIHLANSEVYSMHPGDSLMLVKGDDLFWHEIGRNASSH